MVFGNSLACLVLGWLSSLLSQPNLQRQGIRSFKWSGKEPIGWKEVVGSWGWLNVMNGHSLIGLPIFMGFWFGRMCDFFR